MENTNQVQDTTSDGDTVREQTYVINPKEIDNPIETLNNKKLITFFNSALVILRTGIITRRKYLLDVLGSNAAAAHRDLKRREMESLPFSTISFGKRLKFQVNPDRKKAEKTKMA